MERRIVLADKTGALPFLIEENAFEGVKRVAKKVARDVEKVCGVKPKVREIRNSVILGQKAEEGAGCAVLCATWGNSRILELLEKQGKLKADNIRGKREVFSLFIADRPFPGIEQALVVCGSDKRGSIYGLFYLSELLGVSPLVFWGDAEPPQKEAFVFTEKMEFVSREPSVKYRGFFINDEWPCFGNWTLSNFGGFTAQMYEHVFELLLRLKGNYLWPAMWTSSFPLDGPGSLNEELADIYGVIIGFSHHEPCLRASEEWDLVRGEDSPYGNEWNYHTNEEGLTAYWADGLKRSGKYGHLVTIGMRGERDSSMLGEDASLAENIDLLKKIILKQRELIGRYVSKKIDSVPQVLALYKEVEAYFYGDADTPGLREWDELQNVMFLLCEDNFGYMRTLPDASLKEHPGGFGMYYHLDYHGGPVSYEWMPSTPFSLIWEQMTAAYDHGVREAWIVNVGDLKGNEVALQYFLTLAYDFDTWGSSAPGSWKQYLKGWVNHNFPSAAETIREKAAETYEGFVKLNHMRRPEALHAGVYHPCHYQETDRMLAAAKEVWNKNEEVYASLNGRERQAYYSMIYYPAKASVNLLRMHLYAGKNAHYAMQGRKAANYFGALTEECIREDKRLAEEFGKFRHGKWKGMELEKHIGFTKWNDDGWRYPVRMVVEPVDMPRMSISRADEEEIALKNYGMPSVIKLDDFLFAGVEKVPIEISNDGAGAVEFEITAEASPEDMPQAAGNALPGWLSLSETCGKVETIQTVYLICNPEYLPQEEQIVRLLVKDRDTAVALEVHGKREKLEENNGAPLPEGTFLDRQGVIVMEAHHYCRKKDTEKGSFGYLTGYGKSGNGMKVFPSTAGFAEGEENPSLTYRFRIPQTGEYHVELWLAPTNIMQNGSQLRIRLETGTEKRTVTVLGSSYRGGDHRDTVWCRGVLEQVRVVKERFSFQEGLQELTVGALEAGLVLERVLIVPVKKPLKQSYLGPEESFCV